MEERILSQIAALQDDADALGAYLMELAKYDDDAVAYRQYYEALLHSEDWYLKGVALYALLSAFNLKDAFIVDSALLVRGDRTEDADVRVTACNGLGNTYERSREVKIMKALMEIVKRDEDDLYLRCVCITNLMKVYGLSRKLVHTFFPYIPTLEKFAEIERFFSGTLQEIESLLLQSPDYSEG